MRRFGKILELYLLLIGLAISGTATAAPDPISAKSLSEALDFSESDEFMLEHGKNATALESEKDKIAFVAKFLRSADHRERSLGFALVDTLPQLAEPLTRAELDSLDRIFIEGLASKDPIARLQFFQAKAMQLRDDDKLNGMSTQVWFQKLDAAAAGEASAFSKGVMLGQLKYARDVLKDREKNRRVAGALDPKQFGDVELLVVSADWCGPCRVLKRDMANQKLPLSGNLEIAAGTAKLALPYRWIDYDKDKAMLRELEIPEGLPSATLVRRGKKIASLPIEVTSAKGLHEVVARMVRESTRSAGNDPEAVRAAARALAKVPSQASEVVIATTGPDASQIPLFSHVTTEDVLAKLKRLGRPSALVLYGSGSDADVDTMEQFGSIFSFYKAQVPHHAGSFTRPALEALMQRETREKTKSSVYVLIGHGSESGMLTWRDPKNLPPQELADIFAKSPSQKVIVSGLCYGGQFANAPSCGFFAARPDRMAAGCWMKPEDNGKIKDYTSTYFAGLLPENRQIADADGDGDVSLAEAHWYAVAHGNEGDSPYTSLDAVFAREIRENPEIPETIRVSEIPELLRWLTPAERKAWDSLLLRSPKPNAPSYKERLAGADPAATIAIRDTKMEFEAFGRRISANRKGILSPRSDQSISESEDPEIDLLAELTASEKEKLLRQLMEYDGNTGKPVLENLVSVPLRTILDNGRIEWSMMPYIKTASGRNGYSLRGKEAFKITTITQSADLIFGTGAAAQLLARMVVRAHASKLQDNARWAEVTKCEAQSARSLLGLPHPPQTHAPGGRGSPPASAVPAAPAR